jgi:hypothetical protein
MLCAMSEQFSEHKLTAILYADVAGYSRLTGRDAEAAEALSRALNLQPNLTLDLIAQALPITHRPSRELFIGSLARAGVPLN